MVYALAVGSIRHNRISLDIAAALVASARQVPCHVYIADVRLLVNDIYYCPDVMGCCEELETENPTHRSDHCLLVEALSPSTASIDRREKLLVYRGIPTLRAYLIVDQETQRVERHFRGDDGIWQWAGHVAGGTVPIPCQDTMLTLVYRRL